MVYISNEQARRLSNEHNDEPADGAEPAEPAERMALRVRFNLFTGNASRPPHSVFFRTRLFRVPWFLEIRDRKVQVPGFLEIRLRVPGTLGIRLRVPEKRKYCAG